MGRSNDHGDAHACLGVPVTEAVSCLIVAELALGCDWQIVSDGPREHGFAHWEPSSKLRIAVKHRKLPG